MFNPNEVLQAYHMGNQILLKSAQPTWSLYVPPGLNIQKSHIVPTHYIYVFCMDLRTNSDLCHLQHKLIGFYNRDEKCLQRGTDWVFK